MGNQSAFGFLLVKVQRDFNTIVWPVVYHQLNCHRLLLSLLKKECLNSITFYSFEIIITQFTVLRELSILS